MTLQNGLVHGDKTYLWVDSGWFDPATGDMKIEQAKHFLGLSFPFAGCFSSSGGNPYAMVDHINHLFPICTAALVEAASSALRAYAATGHAGSLLIAAWDGEPRLFLIRSFDGLPGSDEPAFEPIEVLHHLCVGAGTPEIEALRSEGLTRRRMHKVINAQIRIPFSYHETFGPIAATRGIGGSITEIVVSRRGVDTSTLRAGIA